MGTGFYLPPYYDHWELIQNTPVNYTKPRTHAEWLELTLDELFAEWISVHDTSTFMEWYSANIPEEV